MINKILLTSAKRDIVYETLEDEWSKKPYVFHSDNLRTSGKHWVHKDIEFNFLISGSAIAYLDNQSIPLTAGDIICVNPYVIHKFITETEAKIGILMINTGFLSKNAVDIEKIRQDLTSKYKSYLSEKTLLYINKESYFKNECKLKTITGGYNHETDYIIFYKNN